MRNFYFSAFAACSLLALSGVIAGCATPNQFANAVVDANTAQELAHNRLVLLNIVRAYKRMPMHFSKMTAARVPVGIGNPTFTLPTPFGPESLVLKYDWSTSIGIQQGVDSIPLDSQEFIRGMTTPVPVGTMLYYLDQGWPQQMILHLFVRSIEVFETGDDGKDKLVQRFVNYPQNKSRFEEFSSAILGLAGCEIDAFADKVPTSYGPVFPSDKLGTLESLAAARAADLRLSPVYADGKVVSELGQTAIGYQLFRDTKFTSLKITNSPLEATPCIVPGELKLPLGSSPNASSKPNVVINSEDRARQAIKPTAARTAVFFLRSPEAMIYYLGEIGRAQLDDGVTDRPRVQYRRDRREVGTVDALLFQLNRGSNADSAVAVWHDSEVFSIPRSNSKNRSMHVVSLLTQLLGLHNKGSDSPTTLNVRSVP